MPDALQFPAEDYAICTFSNPACTVLPEFAVRAWEGLAYCQMPADEVQTLSLYAPEGYFHGGSLNGYTLHTAPIFLPNTVGGYMPGPAAKPEARADGTPNTVLAALRHGYVVACAGIRGRTSADGRAPALIADMKAAIRYLRHNRYAIPGDTERMITSGTSAGGALSALAGASGNQPDYEPYLRRIGAAEERDDVFAANCYCPIINLENADPAYEWQFGDERFYRGWHGEGEMDGEQAALSRKLKPLFAPWLNSLGLKDENETPLTVGADGTGAFLDRVCDYLMESAQQAGAEEDYLTIQNGRVTAIDWKRYVHAITRMKAPPAFDALDLSSPENDVFGSAHFTAFSAAHSGKNGKMADQERVRLLNPLCWIGKGTAKHWRIRHGSSDRDTSLAIPVILAETLRMQGFQVDFRLPWSLPHSGDYDLPELFAWIDGLCR